MSVQPGFSYQIDSQEAFPLVLRCSGELDFLSAKTFRSELEELIAQHGRLILDLSEIRHVDSSGLGVFLSCREGISAFIVPEKSHLRRVFRVVGVEKIFTLLSSLEDYSSFLSVPALYRSAS